MKRTLIIIGLSLTLGSLAFLLICSAPHPQPDDKTYQEARQSHMKAYAVDIPGKADFAGETVPLDLYWVREALDRELLTNVYWHSSTLLMLKRANRHFPFIEPLLRAKGIPDDFKYLALAESAFTHTVSPAGASGYWQFMKETAKKHGLEVTEEVDERYHLEKATLAACAYLKEAYSRFGSWTLAAAAYNAGPENIAKPIDIQKGTNFYELLLNQETSRYVFRVLAIKEIHRQPEMYGFHLRQADLYPPIPTTGLLIDSSITDLAAFAKSRGLNYKLLKEFNPWLRKNSLTIKAHKRYTLDLPDPERLFYSKLLNE